MFRFQQKEVPTLVSFDNQNLWQNVMNTFFSIKLEARFRSREQISDDAVNSIYFIESKLNLAKKMT